VSDRKILAVAVAAMLVAVLALTQAFDYKPAVGVNGRFKAKMTPYDVVPPVHSKGIALLDLTIESRRENGNFVYGGWYTVMWSDLSSPPLRIYLAFGKPGQKGGVIMWICGGGGKPSCPNATMGAIDYLYIPSLPIPLNSEDIQAIPEQGVKAGDIDAFATALFNGAIYAQIDTVNFPNGELRGQLTR